MKAYLSYSKLGYKGKPNKDLINLHKISAFYAKKHFGEVHLITDSYSKDFFKDIPWTSVSTELDDVPADYSEVWSLSKLYAYREICKRGDPFIHIDNDVILWRSLPDRVINAEVFVQCPEEVGADSGHMYMLDLFVEKCSALHLLKKLPKYSYNMGIFGGKNLKFISNYSEKAISFVLDPKNEYFWKYYKNKNKNSWWKAVLAEQLFLAGAEKYYNQQITCLFDAWPKEEMCRSVNYSHLMTAKKDPETIEKINTLVQLLKL